MLDQLTPYERLLVEQIMAGESLREFIKRVSPEEPFPEHLAPIAEAVERARWKPLRLCISVPPGHAKTTILCRAIAWWLSLNPADTCAYVSYSDQQARSKSRIALQYIVDAGRVEIVNDSLQEWRTNYMGGLLAAGARGKLTGQRVHGLLVIDDPYKSRDEVESDLIRTRIQERFKEVAITRITGGSIIIVHTRWSEDDLIGHCTSEMGWELINLPAIAEPNDPVGRPEGAALWPEHYPVAQCVGPCGHLGHLDTIREELGEWSFSALYQGRPRPRSEGMFAEEWFSIVDEAPEGGRSVRGWDFAGSTTDKSPYTVGVKAKILGKKLYIEDVARVRKEANEMPQYFEDVSRADGPRVIVDIPQDPGQAGKWQRSDFVGRLHGYDVRYSPEAGKKASRAMPLSAQGRARNIVLVRGEWNKDFKRELAKFPVGKYADQVDAAVRAYARLAQMANARQDFSGGHVVDVGDK